MTATRACVIICDGCHARSDAHRDPATARYRLKAQGWTHIHIQGRAGGPYDQCPDCTTSRIHERRTEVTLDG